MGGRSEGEGKGGQAQILKTACPCWVGAWVENAVGMAYTLANHAYLQVLSICVPARSLAPITSRDDERTPYAKL
jgi:hypothetical protein